jgi:hypothetical protein
MEKLTKDYIDEHRPGIHTYDSFSRNLVEHLLNETAKQAGENGIDSATVTVQFQIMPYPPRRCVIVRWQNGYVHVYPNPI